jgi:hypothetical protein
MTAVLVGGETVTGQEPAEPSVTSHISIEVTGIDRDAEFSMFMVEASPALSRTAWLLCGDVHRAEELVQQALVRTYLAAFSPTCGSTRGASTAASCSRRRRTCPRGTRRRLRTGTRAGTSWFEP